MNILLEQMLSHADPSQVPGLARFFKTGPGQYGEGDKFLGIKVPVTRAIVKECWRKVGTPWDGKGGASWDGRSGSFDFPELEECICSEYHEVRLAALLTLVEIFKHSKRSLDFARDDKVGHFDQVPPLSFRPSEARDLSFRPSEVPPLSFRPSEARGEICIDFYLSHTQFINNWDLVDLSCYPLLGEWLLDSPDRSLLYNLARNGRTIWEQRIGIVSTMTFIRHGQLDDTFAIADILLHHPHDLIHKAVGWLLREAGKRNKPALEAYLAPRYAVMPRTMLRYAIEKFPEVERQRYLAR